MATAKTYRKQHDRKIKGKSGIGSRTIRVKATHSTYKKKRK